MESICRQTLGFFVVGGSDGETVNPGHKHRAGANTNSTVPHSLIGSVQSEWSQLCSGNKHPPPPPPCKPLKLHTVDIYLWITQISPWTPMTLQGSLCVGSTLQADLFLWHLHSNTCSLATGKEKAW